MNNFNFALRPHFSQRGESAGKSGSKVLYIAMTHCEEGVTYLVRRTVLATAKLRSDAKDCRRSERTGGVLFEN